MKASLALIFIVLALTIFSVSAFATTQHLINVQGKAVNKTTGTAFLEVNL